MLNKIKQIDIVTFIIWAIIFLVIFTYFCIPNRISSKGQQELLEIEE